MTSASMLLVICAMMEEPAALGCTAVMSPERPIPCPNLMTISKINKYTVVLKIQHTEFMEAFS
jgi:hypothetical protein